MKIFVMRSKHTHTHIPQFVCALITFNSHMTIQSSHQRNNNWKINVKTMGQFIFTFIEMLTARPSATTHNSKWWVRGKNEIKKIFQQTFVNFMMVKSWSFGCGWVGEAMPAFFRWDFYTFLSKSLVRTMLIFSNFFNYV